MRSPGIQSASFPAKGSTTLSRIPAGIFASSMILASFLQIISLFPGEAAGFEHPPGVSSAAPPPGCIFPTE